MKMVSVASRTSRAEMWRKLRDQGWPIIDRWIRETEHDMRKLWEQVDDDCTIASNLVLYVEPEDFPLKGALIQVGMMLGLGGKVAVVMPGVKTDDTHRPIGSWIYHPNVSIHVTIEQAFKELGIERKENA